jgi:hypothetical protein
MINPNDNGTGSGSGSGRSGTPYIPKLRFEVPYAVSSSPANRYAAQDAMIFDTTRIQDIASSAGRDAASAESTLWSRYGVALNNFMVFLTGTSEYIK